MSKLKKINMTANYIFASNIVDLFNSSDIHKELETVAFIDYGSANELVKNLLDRGKECFLNQKKYTFLHYFIDEYINNYLSEKKYYLIDFLCEAYEPESFISFFDELNNMISDNKKLEFKYKKSIRDFEEKFIESEFNLEKEYKELVVNLFYNFINEFNKVYEDIIEATFYLLYDNKKFLYKFNEFIAEHIKANVLPEKFYNKNGNIDRKSYLPKWLKRAIYYRDRGRCQHCNKDLSNTINILNNNEVHFDHIIPLEQGGTNDSTNYQLLCAKCNYEKGSKTTCPDYYYQMYW